LQEIEGLYILRKPVPPREFLELIYRLSLK